MMKTLKELNIVDDFLFTELMKDMEAAKIILQIILNKPIEKVEQWKVQEDIKTTPENHGIRLDVYIKDSKGTVYNVEAQAQRKYDIPKRIRYYQSLIDYSHMPAGEINYNLLPTTFIIFLCDHDIFGKGKYQYTFENRCLEDFSMQLGDSATKIILNTKGKNKEEIRPELERLLKYVSDTTRARAEDLKDEWIEYLQKKVDEIKNSEEKELSYMTWAEKLYDAKKEGMEEGEAKGIVIGTIKTMLRLKCSADDIEKMLKEEYKIEKDEAVSLIAEVQKQQTKAS